MHCVIASTPLVFHRHCLAGHILRPWFAKGMIMIVGFGRDSLALQPHTWYALRLREGGLVPEIETAPTLGK
jgi:hypothetical protein